MKEGRRKRRKDGREVGRKRRGRENGRGKHMTHHRLTVRVSVIYTTVFEYQNQVIFDVTVFDSGPRCQSTLAFGIQTKISLLVCQKQVIF
jgi:hypothetical protein